MKAAEGLEDSHWAFSFSQMASAVGQAVPWFLGAELGELISQRPLQEHEDDPVRVILSALADAARAGDRRGYQQTLELGLSLLAKWPEYLCSLFENQHPSLQFRPPPAASESSP